MRDVGDRRIVVLAILLLVGMLAAVATWPHPARRAAPGPVPVYRASALEALIAADPQAWIGRSVRVRGYAVGACSRSRPGAHGLVDLFCAPLWSAPFTWAVLDRDPAAALFGDTNAPEARAALRGALPLDFAAVPVAGTLYPSKARIYTVTIGRFVAFRKGIPLLGAVMAT